jgi:hypothetical protein
LTRLEGVARREEDLPMDRELRAGDRVRLATWDYFPVCRRGDRGTIRQVLTAPVGSTVYYLVALDKDDPTRSGVVFQEHEIDSDEPRAQPRRPFPW